MTASVAVQGRLKEIKPQYEDVVRLQAKWETLQSVEVAIREYSTHVTEIEQALDLRTLKKRKYERAQELYVLQEGEYALPPEQPVKLTPPPRGVGRNETGLPSPDRSDLPTVPPDNPPNHDLILAARRGMKRLIPRLALTWQLDSNLQGRLNRIVDDRTRPLGEALSLLTWNAYEDSTGTRETESEHLRRLIEWEQALKQYHEWLERQISLVETQYQHSLHIWRLWQSRNTDEGQLRWKRLMDGMAEDLRQEASKLQDEIAEIEREIANLRVRTMEDTTP